MDKLSRSSSSKSRIVKYDRPNQSCEVELVEPKKNVRTSSAFSSASRRRDACSGCRCKIERVQVDAVRKARERVATFRNKKPAMMPLRTLFSRFGKTNSDLRSKSRSQSKKARLRMLEEPLIEFGRPRNESFSAEKLTQRRSERMTTSPKVFSSRNST